MWIDLNKIPGYDVDYSPQNKYLEPFYLGCVDKSTQYIVKARK